MQSRIMLSRPYPIRPSPNIPSAHLYPYTFLYLIHPTATPRRPSRGRLLLRLVDPDVLLGAPAPPLHRRIYPVRSATRGWTPTLCMP
ncbi:hypothetical protein Hypma_012619 [Hypsizygus marmoreus]|uniref:Uncharacterized protein n=1 Tax=Hypsizygus marmoreus TaxID=39966 RepID=A0A369JKS9_HYPMA|nr:hypothetical protein Hypma_012619 [Hypsizygus marmoreus]